MRIRCSDWSSATAHELSAVARSAAGQRKRGNVMRRSIFEPARAVVMLSGRAVGIENAAP